MRTFLLLAALALAACPGPKPAPPEDAGEALPPAYDGETRGGSIPDVPAGLNTPEPLIDAGPIVVDPTCCQTQFRIDDREPAGATGALVGSLAVFAGGVPLVRAGGEWTAPLCFPINTGGAYRYEFRWDAGVEDGGTIDLDDGGVQVTLIPLVGFSARASGFEPGFDDANGERWNLYRAVTSCDGLDGSVP